MNRNIRRRSMLSCYPNGFTLTELLVVVLIIGILVAVALPQYQHAVLKSRISSVIPLAKALRDGNETYYLTHGSYSNDLSQLDITATRDTHNSSTTLKDGTTVTLGADNKHTYVMLGKTNLPNHYIMYQKHSKYFPGEIHCEAEKNNEQANWLCQEGLQGTLVSQRALTNNYNTYVLEGTGNGAFPKMWTNVSEQVLEPGDSCTTGYHATECNNITVTNGSCKPGVGSGNPACQDSVFNNSICESNGNGGACSNNIFNNSTCEADAWSTCVGSTTTFNNSVCNARISNWACGGTFNNSTCNAYGSYGNCQGRYNHSFCYAQTASSSQYSCLGTYTNSSVCYSLAPGGCHLSTFKDTSYCDGTYCPNNAPSNVAGKKWYRGTGEDWPADRPSELVNK